MDWQAVRLLTPVMPWKLVLSPGEKRLIFRSTSYAKTQPCRLFKVPRSYGCTISHQSYNMNTVSITYPYKSVGNVLIMWVTINSTIRSKKNLKHRMRISISTGTGAKKRIPWAPHIFWSHSNSSKMYTITNQTLLWLSKWSMNQPGYGSIF